jgi:hypothetical protein
MKRDLELNPQQSALLALLTTETVVMVTPGNPNPSYNDLSTTVVT